MKKCPYCHKEVKLFVLFSQPPNPRHYMCINKDCEETKGKWLVEKRGGKDEV